MKKKEYPKKFKSRCPRTILAEIIRQIENY